MTRFIDARRYGWRSLAGMTSLAALVTLAPPVPESAATVVTEIRALQGDAISIRGTVTGSAKATLLTAPSTYRLDVTASGPVSLGGNATATWVLPEVTVDLPGRIMRIKNRSWGVTLDVASGDRILGDYTFRSTDIPLSAAGDFKLVADVAAKGGTGRFVGVKGRAVSTVTGNVVSRTLTVEFSGDGERPKPPKK